MVLFINKHTSLDINIDALYKEQVFIWALPPPNLFLPIFVDFHCLLGVLALEVYPKLPLRKCERKKMGG